MGTHRLLLMDDKAPAWVPVPGGSLLTFCPLWQIFRWLLRIRKEDCLWNNSHAGKKSVIMLSRFPRIPSLAVSDIFRKFDGDSYLTWVRFGWNRFKYSIIFDMSLTSAQDMICSPPSTLEILMLIFSGMM